MTKKLRTIALEELEHFQLDDSDRLHWKDRRVYLDRQISLSGFERVVAVIIAGSALVSALASAWQAMT